MKNGIIGGVVGAVIALLVAYVAWERPLQTRVNSLTTATPPVPVKPRDATITLTRDPDNEGHCKAAIDNEHIGGFEEEYVHFDIVNDELPSCADGGWAVYIDFKDVDFPTDTKRIRIGRGHKDIKVKKGSKHNKLHRYSILMVNDNGSDYPMMDPDLEVEPPVTVTVPPGN